MNFKKLIQLLPGIAFWMLLLFFSLLLAHNAALYFTHGGEYGILPEKTVARQDIWWNIAFYIHLPTGTICLLTPFLLFARAYRKVKRLHQLIGSIFVWTTLLLVCPTGMYLSMYAKGGAITQAGFMLQGVLLALFTWLGRRAILRGDLAMHINHMIRAYAMVAVVLSFRIYHILFFLWNVPYVQNYAISQWLGMAGNALIAEVIIIMISSKNRKSIHINSQVI